MKLKLYDRWQAAEILGVSKACLADWHDNCGLEAGILFKRVWAYTDEDIEQIRVWRRAHRPSRTSQMRISTGTHLRLREHCKESHLDRNSVIDAALVMYLDSIEKPGVDGMKEKRRMKQAVTSLDELSGLSLVRGEQ